MDPVGAGAVPAGPPSAAPATGGTAPAAPLQAGALVDVRVLRALDAGRFLVAVGNQRLVADSEAELTPGSQVRMKVAATAADGLVLRLATPVSTSLSDATQRLGSAGLPNTPAAAAVLAAFEEVGAPLIPARLQAALADVSRAQAGPQTATAHALLAQAQLPATPALIRLATRAASGTLPSLGAALRELAATAEPAAAEAERAMPEQQPDIAEHRLPPVGAMPSPADGRPKPALPGTLPAPSSTEPTRVRTDQPVPRTATAITPLPMAQDRMPAVVAVPAPTVVPRPMDRAAVVMPTAAPTATPTAAPAPAPTAPPNPAMPAATPLLTVPGTQAAPQAPVAASVPGTPQAAAPPAAATPAQTQTQTRSIPLPTVPSGTQPTAKPEPVLQLPAATSAPDDPPPAAAPGPQRAAAVQQPTAGTQQPAVSSHPWIGSTQPPAATVQRPVAGSQQPINQQPAAAPQPQQPPAPATSAPAVQTAAPSRPEPVTLRQLADLVLPDPARDGAPAVVRALTLAGVRPAASPLPAQLQASSMPALSTAAVLALLPGAGRQIAAALPADMPATPSPAEPARTAEPQSTSTTPRHELPASQQAQRQEPASPPTTPPQPAQPELEQSAARAMREHLADQVFKPKDLADYDRVVPLPLAANDLPTPARLAVATRSTGGGMQATFVRVDAELSRLGNVSIRLSGADTGGPMAITLVASPRAGALLAEELPALVADLRALGLEAGVRVVADG